MILPKNAIPSILHKIPFSTVLLQAFFCLKLKNLKYQMCPEILIQLDFIHFSSIVFYFILLKFSPILSSTGKPKS